MPSNGTGRGFYRPGEERACTHGTHLRQPVFRSDGSLRRWPPPFTTAGRHHRSQTKPIGLGPSRRIRRRRLAGSATTPEASLREASGRPKPAPGSPSGAAPQDPLPSGAEAAPKEEEGWRRGCWTSTTSQGTTLPPLLQPQDAAPPDRILVERAPWMKGPSPESSGKTPLDPAATVRQHRLCSATSFGDGEGRVRGGGGWSRRR
jgi:hypothetical protein